MAVMSCLSNLLAAVSSSTGVFPSPSCTMVRIMEITTLLVGAAIDTVFSFDGLLIFLISSIALTLFAAPLLTVALGSTITIAAVTLYRTHEAHRAFMALAPGGLPSSFAGFLKTSRVTRGGSVQCGDGFLQQLACRQGPTPYTIGTSPHQQYNQQSPEDIQQYFADRLSLFAILRSGDNGDIPSPDATTFVVAKSCDCIHSPQIRTFGCTVCSPERSSCGTHVILHPSDLEQVVQTGWGEIHPLANTRNPFAHFGLRPCLPGTLALIYAPREYSEVCTVMRIIEAGANYTASVEGSSR